MSSSILELIQEDPRFHPLITSDLDNDIETLSFILAVLLAYQTAGKTLDMKDVSWLLKHLGEEAPEVEPTTDLIWNCYVAVLKNLRNQK